MELVENKPTQFANLTRLCLKTRKALYENENEPQVQHEREPLDYGFARGIDEIYRKAGIELQVLEVPNRYNS
jgi:hypothetical protein